VTDRRAFLLSLLALYGCGQDGEPQNSPDASNAAPPVEPPPLLGRLSSQGKYAHGGNAPFPVGTVDQIDVSNAGKEIPFDPRNFADFANLILAPSVGGKRVEERIRLPLHGVPMELYWQIPILQNGAIRQYTPSVSSHDFDLVLLPGMKANYPNNGPRGVSRADPYVTMHAHPTLKPDGTAIPRAPYLLAMRVDGSMIAYYLDGRVEILGVVPGTLGPLDFSYFPPAREIFFTADTSNHRIIRTDRTAAMTSRPPNGTENGALWTHTTIFQGDAPITGVRCRADGTMFFAVTGSGISKQVMDAAGHPVGSPTLFSSFPAFALDYFNNGDLVAASLTAECRIIDGDTGASTRIGDHPLISDTGFITVAVDRKGTCAPVGTIFLSPERYSGVRISTNNQIVTLHPADGYAKWQGDYIQYGYGYSEIGPAAFTSEPQHYLWGVEPGVDQAILTVLGTSNSVPSTYRPRRALDPVYDTYRPDLLRDFWAVLAQGTVAGMEGKRPSFLAQMSPVGDGLLGVSADTIANMTIPDASKFLVNGALGNTPRPELAGTYCLWVLHRGLVRHSQRWILEGASLIASVDAFYGNPPATGVPALP